MGLPRGALFDTFDTVNLLKRYPGKHAAHRPWREKGDAFPAKRGRRAAARLLEAERDRAVVVLLGGRVAHAAGLPRSSRLGWHEAPTGRVIVTVPHPSGCNQWWNDPSNCLAAHFYLWAAVALAAHARRPRA